MEVIRILNRIGCSFCVYDLKQSAYKNEEKL